MGFWDFAYTTAPEIGHYINQNAANVGHTATAMGVPALSTGEKLFPHLVQEIEKAGADLKNKVDRDPDLQKPKETSKGPYDLPAFWPAPPAYSSDINKFLTLNHLPTSVGEGKDATDVGQEISKQIFNEGKNLENDAKKFKNTFSVKDEKTGLDLQGGHVFYKLPVGKNGTDEGMLSHLRAWEV